MRARPALQFPPLFYEVPKKGVERDGYVTGSVLRLMVRNASRYWSFKGNATTVELPGRRMLKNADAFTGHNKSEPRFLELVREYGEHGCPRPTSYADVFHKHFESPRVKWTHNAVLAPHFAGGWQQALQRGEHPGVFYKYDMRSAYLWAGSLGLPRVKSYRYANKLGTRDGVFVIELRTKDPRNPYPFDRFRRVLATPEEIERYSLDVRRVLHGVTWDGYEDPRELLAAIHRVGTWKEAGRMYWGRWAQTDRVRCHTPAKEWALPSLSANVPWAHIIVSRVRQRVWQHAHNAVHVFVDSLITPEWIEPTPEVGGWKLEKTYANGVDIRGTGVYGPLGQRPEKHAGLALAKRNPQDVAVVDVCA